MNEENESCNFLAPVVKDASVPYNSLFVRLKKGIMAYRDSAHARFKDIFYPKKSSKEMEPLNVQAGEWVEVRSLDEISQTLNEKRKYKGLYFMPEMEKFCGKKCKVFKKVEVIKLEETGEIRKLKTPTVFLEGVYCNGERHEGCDRSCFHFWKEAWLKRISAYVLAAAAPLFAIASEFTLAFDCDYCFLCFSQLFTECSLCPICNILHPIL